MEGKLPKGMLDVYQYMWERRKDVLSSDFFFTDKIETIHIWQGYGTEISEFLGSKVQSIYQTISRLHIIGCVIKIRHGGKGVPSVYQLLKEPEPQEYEIMREMASLIGQRTVPTKSDRLQDNITNLTNRLNDLERRLKRVEDG